jgi:hypothetical protein
MPNGHGNKQQKYFVLIPFPLENLGACFFSIGVARLLHQLQHSVAAHCSHVLRLSRDRGRLSHVMLGSDGSATSYCGTFLCSFLARIVPMSILTSPTMRNCGYVLSGNGFVACLCCCVCLAQRGTRKSD